MIVALEAAIMGKRWTREQAEHVLQAWRSSGQSVEAFARDRELPSQRLRYWFKRLGSQAGERNAGGGVSLLPVRVASSLGGAVEIQTPGGCVVRVGPGFDEDALLRVVALLGRAR